MCDTHRVKRREAMKVFKVFGIVSKVADKIQRKTAKAHRKATKADRKAQA